MPNRQYERGTRFEHKVIHDLIGHGYVTVRAAGSKGAGKVDVIAVLPAELQRSAVATPGWPAIPGHLWIQCKITGDIGPEEFNRICQTARWAGAVPIIASNGPNGRGVTYERITGPRAAGIRRNGWPVELYDVRARSTIQA